MPLLQGLMGKVAGLVLSPLRGLTIFGAFPRAAPHLAVRLTWANILRSLRELEARGVGVAVRAKARITLLTLLARLKPCPCYKA